MLVEFLRQWQHIVPGRVLDLGGGIADVLVRRGIAKPAVEAAAPASIDPPKVPPSAVVPATPAKRKGK